MTTYRNIILGAALTIGVTLSSAVNASLITFTDKTTFLTATSATSATGPIPFLGSFGPSVPVVIGSLTFEASPPATSLEIGTSNTVLLPGTFEIALSDVENLNVTGAPMNAFGFDFAEPTGGAELGGGPHIDSTFTVTLLSGGGTVGGFTFTAANDTAAFVGVSSTISFDRVEIRETVGGLENEYYGEFVAAAAAAQVPEPGMIAIFGLGLAGLGFARRRKIV